MFCSVVEGYNSVAVPDCCIVTVPVPSWINTVEKLSISPSGTFITILDTPLSINMVCLSSLSVKV